MVREERGPGPIRGYWFFVCGGGERNEPGKVERGKVGW